MAADHTYRLKMKNNFSPKPFESARKVTQTPTNSKTKLTPNSNKIHEALSRASVVTNKKSIENKD